MSVFTDDGVFVDQYGRAVSMEEMPDYFEEYAPGFVEVERVGNVELADDETSPDDPGFEASESAEAYGWTSEIVDAGGARWTGPGRR